MRGLRLSQLLVVTVISGLPSPVLAWGPRAHEAVTHEAISALSGPLAGYYERHRLELPSLAPDGKRAPEGSERRFAVDRLLPFPFRDLPHTESEWVTKFGEPAQSAGRLPWLVREAYGRLVAAFREGDKKAILTESDLLAAALTDLHNPLALSDNADGQKTGQHGLWTRFSDRFPARISRLKVEADGAYLVDDPNGYVFSILSSTYIWLDNILYADDAAHRHDPSYTGVFYENLEARAGTILRDRLSWAARDVASYWYTAWVAAGRPEVR